MLPQAEMIQRLRHQCQNDPRLVAAMLYGSFTYSEGDRYSDIDCLLYFHEEHLPAIDQPAWLNQIAPVELYYHNEFGNGVAIFANLVRGEFHFDPVTKMADLATFAGQITFPSSAATILVDKTGQLAQHLQPLIGRPPERNTPQEIRFLADSFLNWMLFGRNVLARGEYARAWELLRLVQDYLLRLARLVEGQTEHWITPTKAAERELSTQAYRRLVAASAALDPQELQLAYQAAWHWGLDLLPGLLQPHGLNLPASLVAQMDRYFQELAS